MTGGKFVIRDEVIENFSIWTRLEPETVKANIKEIEDMQRINTLLDLNVMGPMERVARRLMHRILLYTPKEHRHLITDTIKRLRQLVRKDLIEVPHCIFVEIYLDLIRKLNIKPLDWRGLKSCVCLTHDVDSAEGYEFINKVLQLEKQLKTRSTYNFLTGWGYKVDRDLLKELSDNNFEIGLHGWTHDIALGCRNKNRIKSELSRAMDELGVPIEGFRAPAFSITRSLLEVLVQLGIKYDSSMKMMSCYAQGVESAYPYRYPGVNIWEIPLTIQDDRIFRDLHLSCEEGLGVVKELTTRVSEVGGVTVINTHPRLLKFKYRFYEDLLHWLLRQPDMLICPMNEVVALMEERVQKGKTLTIRQ